MEKMNRGLFGFYSGSQGVVRKVLVSAENLQFTLSSDFSLEERTLRCHHGGCLEAKTTGYQISIHLFTFRLLCDCLIQSFSHRVVTHEG